MRCDTAASSIGSPDPDIPVLANVEFGHAGPNLPMPVGVRVSLDAEHRTLSLLEPAVRPHAVTGQRRTICSFRRIPSDAYRRSCRRSGGGDAKKQRSDGKDRKGDDADHRLIHAP